MGRDSVVSIVTQYGLDGLGSNPSGGRDFLHPSRQSLGSTQRPCTMGTASLSQGKAAGALR